ncbi:MAG TPA: glycosyltransferase family 39 protein [Verrucomicrobiae bacterium]|nr:glycosyltransferase family 39 protein [Verrucomicrobiae bacterium]
MKLRGLIKGKFLVSLLLLWVAGMGIYQAQHHTLTSDEAIHTASAYLAMTRGEHRFDPEHPFLFKYLTAVPFLVYKTNLPARDMALWDGARPTSYDSWGESRTWADHWVYESGNNAETMQFLMRLPGIVLLVLLNWLVWWLARRWFNEKVANWALFFTAFNPTLLAHGYMTNTDVPLALMFILALWRVWEYWLMPNKVTALWLGVALSGALLTKFSAIALIPIIGIWVIATAYTRRTSWARAVGHLGLIAVTFIALAWITYFFKSPLTPGSTEIVSATHTISQYQDLMFHLEGVLGFKPQLLPSAYVKGLLMVLAGGQVGREVFFLGTAHGVGVWYYFPVIFLLKSQLVALGLLATGLGLASKQLGRPRSWSPLTWLLVISGGIFMALAMKSKLNLGIRHISPVFPLVSLGLAVTMARIQPLLRSHLLPTLVVVGYALPVLAQGGNLIGFGNIVTTPGKERHHFFQDSNLDWTQSWSRIGTVLEKEFPGQPVYLSYYQSGLTYYAPDNKQLPASRAGSDGPGAILVSASSLNGHMREYQQYEPAFIVDDAYFIYRTDGLVPR